MSLLMNEDFTLYNLRLAYLQTINDGVGERLITLDPAVLTDPAFKAAGFTPDHAAIKRCYSPPIPTTGAAEYFTRPARSRLGFTLTDGETHDEDGGGLLTGHTSDDTLGPMALKEKRRRRERVNLEEDDSSDLSDDSDEYEDEEETVVQGVRFAKSKERKDSSLSPPRLRKNDQGPEVHIISPSFRPRTSSLGATEAPKGIKKRPRGDTITSSEFSSESEMLDVNAVFKRKLPSRPQRTPMLASKIAEEEEAEDSDLLDDDDDEEEEDAEVAEASDLSDDFEGDDVAVPSPDFLRAAGGATSSPLQGSSALPTPAKKVIEPNPVVEELIDLPGLPAGRAITANSSHSLLSMALHGSNDTETGQTFRKYAELSGQGEAAPIWIKIHYPFAQGRPLEVPLRRHVSSEGGVPKVSDLIGLALYRYEEEGREPALRGADLKLAQWELRMVDDGEIEMDFPALVATRPITDFTSNNNRPPQRRARDKPWDEFGLIRVQGAEAGVASDDRASIKSVAKSRPVAPPSQPSMVSLRNPITGPSLSLARIPERKDSSQLLDTPAIPTTTATPRTGPPRDVSIHFTDPQSFHTQTISMESSTDTYIAEIFDMACTRLRLDKALYVLKVRGTQTVAPPDRTVEALGTNLHLDLARRRFGAVGDFGLGTSGSPGSTSPNAPLELVPNTPPTSKDAKRRRAGPPVANAGRAFQTMAASTFNIHGVQDGRRYHVMRKQPLSFAASHPRTLVITPEFMQVLPAQNADDGPVIGKVTNIHMSSIIGVKVSRKHPKLVRVVVFKEKEAKRYDFECVSKDEAQAIVADISVGVGEYGSGAQDLMD